MDDGILCCVIVEGQEIQVQAECTATIEQLSEHAERQYNDIFKPTRPIRIVCLLMPGGFSLLPSYVVGEFLEHGCRLQAELHHKLWLFKIQWHHISFTVLCKPRRKIKRLVDKVNQALQERRGIPPSPIRSPISCLMRWGTEFGIMIAHWPPKPLSHEVRINEELCNRDTLLAFTDHLEAQSAIVLPPLVRGDQILTPVTGSRTPAFPSSPLPSSALTSPVKAQQGCPKCGCCCHCNCIEDRHELLRGTCESFGGFSPHLCSPVKPVPTPKEMTVTQPSIQPESETPEPEVEQENDMVITKVVNVKTLTAAQIKNTIKAVLRCCTKPEKMTTSGMQQQLETIFETSLSKRRGFVEKYLKHFIDHKSWMQEGKRSHIVARVGDIAITKADLDTLNATNWLNDEVINFYLQLVKIKAQENGRKVFAFSTFFYPKLKKGGFPGVKMWTRKVRLSEDTLLLFPIHLGNHWCLATADLEEHVLDYFNSLPGTNDKCLKLLKDYIDNEILKDGSSRKELVVQNQTSIPRQQNGYDCGVFTCKYAEHVALNLKLSFTQSEMPAARNAMKTAIYRGFL